MTKDEYTYRPPRWFIRLFVVLGFAPALIVFISVAVLERSWAIGIGGSAILVAEAMLVAWVWSKLRIVVDSERIRLPRGRRELRWEDIEASTIVKILGFEYVRVLTRSGKVRWIALNEPSGRNFSLGWA